MCVNNHFEVSEAINKVNEFITKTMDKLRMCDSILVLRFRWYLMIIYSDNLFGCSNYSVLHNVTH